MSEAELQANVVATCKTLGLLTYHTYSSIRSDPGFPDLTIVGQGVLFRELKSSRGRTTSMQDYWLAALSDAGQDVGVWRPSDWPDIIVPELKALGRVKIPKPQLTQKQLLKKMQSKTRPVNGRSR